MAISPLCAHLLELVEEASASLSGVTWKRMFGCDAAFVSGSIYALIWKDGRIGLKLPNRERFEALLSLEGAVPWTPGRMSPMAKWVLVPESFHDDTAALAEWVREAHGEVSAEEKTPAKKKTTRAAATSTKKPPVAKKSAPAAKKAGAKKR